MASMMVEAFCPHCHLSQVAFIKGHDGIKYVWKDNCFKCNSKLILEPFFSEILATKHRKKVWKLFQNLLEIIK